ncbi:MAG: CoA transferase [Rhodobacteraceae bacterium]|nr:CoA transferase [Paracoccaceae bacterium]
MADDFRKQIAQALNGAAGSPFALREVSPAQLEAYFDVSGLATAALGAAAAELGALLNARDVTLDHRRALMWFDMTLRPRGWALPSLWDKVAGNYQAADGWIRLHTNAPHHLKAALSVLGCAGERADVAAAVRGWGKTALEAAVVSAGGCAAEMRSMGDWAQHVQGRAVAQEPLIAWEDTGAEAAPAALEGLHVLDLTRVLAGPVATRFLAGFGAQVLRIDPPSWDEPGVVPEVTLGKRCAGLDLKTQADRKVFEALLSKADVLVHGYRPGALSGLGYDTQALKRLAPGLAPVTLNAYGWTGPWAARRGFDSLVQMSSGIAEAGMRLSQADKPVPLPVQALDHATGYLMAAAVLRALNIRNQTGKIMSARLSLARVAALLTSGGAGLRMAAGQGEDEADLAQAVEATSWGPARRIAFPVLLNGQPPRWLQPAGALRRDRAEWVG